MFGKIDQQIIRLIIAWFLTASPWFCVSTALPIVVAGTGSSYFAASFLAAASSIGIFLVCLFVPRLLQYTTAVTLNRLASLSVIIACTSLCIFSSYIVYCVASLIIGLGCGLRWVITDAWVTELGAETRGRTVGFYEAVSGSTLFAGPALAAATLFDPVITFAVCLAASLLAAFLCWNCKGVIHEQSQTIMRFSFVKEALQQPRAFVASFIGGMFECGSGAVLALWLMHQQLIDQSTAAFLVTGLGIGSCLMQIPIGLLSERYSVTRVQLVCAALLPIGGALLLVSSAAPLLLPFIAALLWGGIGGGLYTLSAIHLGDHLQDKRLIVGIAAATFAYTIGSSLGPLLGGMALELSPHYGLPLLFLFIGCSAWFLIRKLSYAELGKCRSEVHVL